MPSGCLVQIRAGTGGEEAALFAGDLLRMYQRYADGQSWKITHLSESAAENGGLKEAIVQVSIHHVFLHFHVLSDSQSNVRRRLGWRIAIRQRCC